jgi:hypothetical protein
MALRTAEGLGEVHVRVDEAGNDEAAGCIDDEIGWSTRKIFADRIDTIPAQPDVARAMYIVGGIDDRSSSDQYRFLRHRDPFAFAPDY